MSPLLAHAQLEPLKGVFQSAEGYGVGATLGFLAALVVLVLGAVVLRTMRRAQRQLDEFEREASRSLHKGVTAFRERAREEQAQEMY